MPEASRQALGTSLLPALEEQGLGLPLSPRVHPGAQVKHWSNLLWQQPHATLWTGLTVTTATKSSPRILQRHRDPQK